jgi:hypothetical protein
MALTGIPVVLAQDVITLKSGGEMKARIIKLNPKDIIFIPENSFDTAYMLRDEATILKYSSGIIIYLSEAEMPPLVSIPGNDTLFILGVTDATINYKGYRPAAIATMISSLYFPFGVIPAIACSATPPSRKSLGYKDPKLMENQSYYEGYTKTAHSIKKKKVWGGFAIGSGFVILMGVLMSGILLATY